MFEIGCVHGDPGAVWHPGEGPNKSDEVRECDHRWTHTTSLDWRNQFAFEARIDASGFGEKRPEVCTWNCMGIDESDPSVSVPVSCSFKFMSLSDG